MWLSSEELFSLVGLVLIRPPLGLRVDRACSCTSSCDFGTGLLPGIRTTSFFFTQSVSAVSPLPNCFLCTVFKGRVRQDAQAPPLQPHPAPPPDIQMYILHICTTLSLPKVLGSDEDGQETDRQKNNPLPLCGSSSWIIKIK